MNSWDHLPNAKYIDLLIESVTGNIDMYHATEEMDHKIWEPAYFEICDMMYESESHNIILDSINLTLGTCGFCLNDAISALILYDNYGHLLDSAPKEVELFAKLGITAAILILPTCKVFNKLKETIKAEL